MLQLALYGDTVRQFIEYPNHNTLEEMPNLIKKLTSIYSEPLTGGLVITGPGSYTGLRLSITCIKMIRLESNIPCVGRPLFYAMLDTLSPLMNQLVVLTSHSTKGHVNLQVFQCNSGNYKAISSLLYMTFEQLISFLNSFETTIFFGAYRGPF